MTRRILFVLFADDGCRQAHAFWYALDLHRDGHQVRLILEGPATQMLARLDEPGFEAGGLVREALDAGVLAGACLSAATGCGNDADTSAAVEAARRDGIPLLSERNGHAAIGPFVAAGYEVVVV